MDSGVPLAPSFTTTSPMTFTHFMGMNPSVFHNGMHNYDTQSMPWVSNHLPLNMPIHSSGARWLHCMHLQFERSLIPQPTLTIGGWNLPSYRIQSYSHFFRIQCSNGWLFYLLHPVSVSFVRYASSYEHTFHGGSPYVLRYFIWRNSMLWYRLLPSWNPFTWGKHISSPE
jgi:hypothetical protein